MVNKLFGGYCYGPVDVMDMKAEGNVLKLALKDAAGKTATAVYEDYVYSQLDTLKLPKRFPMVKLVTAEEIEDSELRESITRWMNEGKRSYLHYGANREEEYLIVCSDLQYR